MAEFEQIRSEDKVEDILKGSVGLDLPVCGGWGYTKEEPLIINSSPMPIEQIQFMFATARATIVMNLTQPKENRYSGINLKELSRKTLEENGESIYKVTYEVTAMLEDVYAKFIKEYKEKHGDENFDLNGHFRRREENTLKLEETIWFKKGERMLKKFIAASLLAVACFGMDYNLSPEKISDTVYRFEGVKEVPTKDNGGNMVNTYWIKGDTSWIVFDSGPSYQYAQQAYEQMKKIAPLPVKYVINTHRHEDHWLGNIFHKEKFGAKIFATKAQASEYPAGIVPGYVNVLKPEDYAGTKVIAIDEFIDKDITMKLDGRSLEFKHFDYAVHSPEDIMAYMPDEKVLLAGDILFSERIPRITDGSVEGGLKSLDVVDKYDVKVYATGHGKFTDNTAIGQMREYFQALKQTALNYIEEGEDLSSYVNSADFSAFKDRYMMDDLHKGNLSHAYREYEFFEEEE